MYIRQSSLSFHKAFHVFICFLLLFPDCESLVRKMLVRDPERRYTVSQILRHRWMQAEVPPETPEDCPSRTMNDPRAHATKEAEAEARLAGAPEQVRSGRKCDVPINEGLLKVMADLGIDTNMTREVWKGCFRMRSCSANWNRVLNCSGNNKYQF